MEQGYVFRRAAPVGPGLVFARPWLAHAERDRRSISSICRPETWSPIRSKALSPRLMHSAGRMWGRLTRHFCRLSRSMCSHGHTGDRTCELHTRKPHRPLGSRDRPGGSRPGDQPRQAVLRRRDRFRRRAQHAGQLRRCRVSRHAAGDQPRVRGAGGAHRAGAERPHQHGQPFRSQELLLRRSAGRLSDQPVSAPDRRRRHDRDRAGRWHDETDRHHPPASGAGRRESRCTTSTRPNRSSTSTAPAWR